MGHNVTLYCKWNFWDRMSHFWNSLSNYGPLGFISMRKLFKVQNLMADKTCSLQNKFIAFILISKMVWRVSLNRNDTKKILLLVLVYFCLTDCSEDNQELYYVFIIESSVHFRWDSSRQDHLSGSPSPSLPHRVYFPAGKFYQVMDWRRK